MLGKELRNGDVIQFSSTMYISDTMKVYDAENRLAKVIISVSKPVGATIFYSGTDQFIVKRSALLEVKYKK